MSNWLFILVLGLGILASATNVDLANNTTILLLLLLVLNNNSSCLPCPNSVRNQFI